MVVDAAGYRERREAALQRAADRAVADALSFGRPVELEPMRAPERKVVHHYLSERTDVETHSEGDEPERRLVVTPLPRPEPEPERFTGNARGAGRALRRCPAARPTGSTACWPRSRPSRIRRRPCASPPRRVDVHIADSLSGLEVERAGAGPARSPTWAPAPAFRAWRWRSRCPARAGGPDRGRRGASAR